MAPSWRWTPTWGAIIGVLVAGAGFVLGARPLRDNSFLTHLATGRLILESGSVPSQDPYTATATGEPWVVQSWLMSVVYASAEAVGGLGLVRILAGAVTAAVALIAWRLLRPVESLVSRLGLAALFFVACAQTWSERPLMVGLIAMGLVLLAVEERWNPRWMLPLGWVWANSHGSHPLGIALLVALSTGAWLDEADWTHERRLLGWLTLGIVLGVVGPLGSEVIVFPFELLSRRDVLSGVVEWRAPTFDRVGQQAFLALLALGVFLSARRPSYRTTLLIALFGSMAVMSLRNLPVAALVLLPGLARGIGNLGSIHASNRPKLGRFVLATVTAVGGVAVASRLQQEDLDLTLYPVDALALMEQEGEEGFVVTEDFVGNLETYVYGPDADSFYDDRFDMFPAAVTEMYRSIAAAGPPLSSALDEVDARWVLWERRDPVVSVLLADPGWRAVHLDDRWALLARRP